MKVPRHLKALRHGVTTVLEEGEVNAQRAAVFLWLPTGTGRRSYCSWSLGPQG